MVRSYLSSMASVYFYLKTCRNHTFPEASIYSDSSTLWFPHRMNFTCNYGGKNMYFHAIGVIIKTLKMKCLHFCKNPSNKSDLKEE